MSVLRNLLITLSALLLLAPTQSIGADEGCLTLKGKDAAAHLEYLRGDRSKLVGQCIVTAIGYVGGKRYAQGSAVLIQYLDYQDPASLFRRDIGASILYAYPAVSALYNIGKPVVPELITTIADAGTRRANPSECRVCNRAHVWSHPARRNCGAGQRRPRADRSHRIDPSDGSGAVAGVQVHSRVGERL